MLKYVSYSKNNLPPYILMIVSETLVSIVGIWLFIIFIDINFFKTYIKKINIKIFSKSHDKNNLLNMI